MSPPPARTATAIVVLFALTLGAAPAGAWPFGPAAPATPTAATPATSKTAATAAKPVAPAAPPAKASPEERAAADRLDLLARSAFWAREVNRDPTDTQAGVEFATVLRLMGRNVEASQAVNKVLIVDPKNLDALLESARDFIGQNQGFYAIDPLKRAIALAPRDWRPLSLMGIAREQNQQPDDAHAAYLQALALSPDNPAVLSNLALWCATHHDAAQAEVLLRRAVAQPTATARERQNLALVLGMEGKLADAEHIMRDDLPPEVANNNLSYLRAAASAPK
ncbi:MAG: tetratricopeptide repeat protein [Caulobacteraceae bacterium]